MKCQSCFPGLKRDPARRAIVFTFAEDNGISVVAISHLVHALVAQISHAGEILRCVRVCVWVRWLYRLGVGRSCPGHGTIFRVHADSWGLGCFWERVSGVGCQRLISRAALGCHLSSRSVARRAACVLSWILKHGAQEKAGRGRMAALRIGFLSSDLW